MGAAARSLVLVGALAALSVAAGASSVLAAETFRGSAAGSAGSAAREVRAGGMSRLGSLLQQPRLELFTGAAVLAALGLFLAWKAFSARTERGAAEYDEPVASVAPAAPAGEPPVAVQSPASQALPPLADRFRSLSALRARDGG